MYDIRAWTAPTPNNSSRLARHSPFLYFLGFMWYDIRSTNVDYPRLPSTDYRLPTTRTASSPTTRAVRLIWPKRSSLQTQAPSLFSECPLFRSLAVLYIEYRPLMWRALYRRSKLDARPRSMCSTTLVLADAQLCLMYAARFVRSKAASPAMSVPYSGLWVEGPKPPDIFRSSEVEAAFLSLSGCRLYRLPSSFSSLYVL